MATTAPQYDFTVTLEDLAFILKQIQISEQTTNPDGSVNGDLLRDMVNPLAPFGLRTVDGSWNNLLPGMEYLGAADNIMPRLTDGTLQTAEARPADLFFPGQPAGTTVTTYANTAPGNVVYDSQPRIISNLIVDQTAENPAAVVAANERAGESTFPGFEDVQVSPEGTLIIPNQSPDIGLSPPLSGTATLFGQFFDHGLDLITKGGGTVFVPLMPDDPLYDPNSSTNFMVLSRAAVDAGADGTLGTADDGHINTTTPFVDQNQTYTSHPSHQVFLREYEWKTVTIDGVERQVPVPTGNLLTGDHGPATWSEVKAQAAEMLGIQLTDADVFNVPLLATDRYGGLILSDSGNVQFVTASGLAPATSNGGLGTAVPADAFRTNHAFLDDIAHHAAPTAGLTADGDEGDVNLDGAVDEADAYADDGLNTTYDDEMLGRHFITGDGRGNENIGLTAIHTVFHSEHNRLVDQYKQTLVADAIARQDATFLREWLAQDLTAEQAASLQAGTLDTASLAWNGERLFQAGRFVNEMEYQHLVFEEFARTIAPTIDPFVFQNSADIDPAIVEEFANVVYRFGHSMLTDTIARTGADMSDNSIGLIDAFLNPVAFNEGGMTEAEAVGQILRGMSSQVANELDEFVTEALRNNLVGLPLDLATINLARARETGMPTFNEARAQFYEATGDSQYLPYTSWADLAPHLKNPTSVINFIAAYGEHDSIQQATTVEAKRDAAMDLVLGTHGLTDPAAIAAWQADRADFLNGTGKYAQAEFARGGVDNIDFWIGGLAEAKLEFGGHLGPTFNYVFETQLENLQNGDRFYYLSRTQGTNMLNELEANTLSRMVMRNSDLGDAGNGTHLPSLIFGAPSFTLEMDQANQRTGIVGPDGVTLNGDPVREGAAIDPLDPDNILNLLNPGNILNGINPLVTRVAPGTDANNDGTVDYNALLDRNGDLVNDYDGYLSYAYDGGDHVVLGGTEGRDILLGGRGMDTVWGDGGNDYIDAGDESDHVHGGDGDDIIVDHGTVAGGADFLRGDGGNDVISGGPGNDLLFGGAGKDFVKTGQDFSEVFAGTGDDFVMGGNGPDVLMGNEGSDWIEGGEGFDSLAGENSELFFNSPIIGHDVLNGQGNDTDYDGESGDDIMIQGTGIQRSNGMYGFDWAAHKGDPVGANSDLGIAFIPAQTEFILRDRFDSVEGLSGWEHDDVLTGAAQLRGGAGGQGDGVDAPPDSSNLKSQNVALIDGFAELLGLDPAVVAGMAPDTDVIDVLNGAEVIIGGAGSDTIQGNLGDDYLDGDAWLNTRIRVTSSVNSANTATEEIMTVDNLAELQDEMLAGQVNPGQLHIVREILQATEEQRAVDIDTAVYNGNFDEYSIEHQADGRVIVTHVAPVAGTLDDGRDTLRNFEQLQFADLLVSLGLSIDGGASQAFSVAENTTAVATVTVSGATPDSFISFALDGTDAAFFDIDSAGVLSFFGAPNYEAAADAGLDNVYDVQVIVTDGVMTDTQDIAVTVTNADDAATGSVRITGYTATDSTADLTALSTLVDEDLLNAGTTQPTLQWQQLVDGTWTDVSGATGSTLTGQSSATERVVVRYDDGFGAKEVASLETAVIGSALADTLAGTTGDDILLGLGGNDALSGDAGNDILDGGIGADSLDGGAGNDTLLGGAGGDNLTGGEGTDTVDGGAGNDTLVASANDGNDALSGGAGTDLYTLAATSAAANVNLTTGLSGSAQTGTDSLTEIENITGSDGGDTITDGAGSNVLTGGAGADTFVMTNDGARDTVNGRGGLNTIDYSANTTGIGVALNNGTLVEVTGTGTLGNTDQIANIDNVIGGSGNDTLSGDGGANILVGNGGSDTLNGNGGADTLDGGAGNDTLNGGAGADTLSGGDGNDTLQATASDGNDAMDGGAGTDLYTLAGTTAAANVNLTAGTSGSAQTGADTLAGVENVTGSSGGDTITDGAGSNVLTGGSGEDTFVMTNDNARDTVNGMGGGNTIDYSANTTGINVTINNGTLVNVGGTGTAGNTDQIANIDHVVGGSGNDTITGDGAANTLSGNGGTDTLNGAGGNDTLNGGIGNDTLLGGTGNDTLNGNDGNDNLQGQDGNDTLNGGAGTDTLTGGMGQDISTGGAGADTFDFNSIAEIPNEAPELRERVMDFTSASGDVLDFSTIDANQNNGSATNETFQFSTTAGDGFSAPGQLRYHLEGTPNVGPGSIMQANVGGANGNVTDAQVALIGVSQLEANDVVG